MSDNTKFCVFSLLKKITVASAGGIFAVKKGTSVLTSTCLTKSLQKSPWFLGTSTCSFSAIHIMLIKKITQAITHISDMKSEQAMPSRKLRKWSKCPSNDLVIARVKRPEIGAGAVLGGRIPPRKKLRFHKVHFEFLSMNPSVKYICCVGKISP